MNDPIIDDLSARPDVSRQLSKKTTDILAKSAGWIKFGAVLGFISIAFSLGILLIGLQNPSTQNTPYAWVSHVISLVGNAIGIITSSFLLVYSGKLKSYAENLHSSELRLAFQSQKTYYTITGVMLIVYISIILLGIAAALILIPQMHR